MDADNSKKQEGKETTEDLKKENKELEEKIKKQQEEIGDLLKKIGQERGKQPENWYFNMRLLLVNY